MELLGVVPILPLRRGPCGGRGRRAGLALLGGRLEVLVAVEHMHRGGVREAHAAGAPPRELLVLRPRRCDDAAAATAAAEVHGDGTWDGERGLGFGVRNFGEDGERERRGTRVFGGKFFRCFIASLLTPIGRCSRSRA